MKRTLKRIVYIFLFPFIWPLLLLKVLKKKIPEKTLVKKNKEEKKTIATLFLTIFISMIITFIIGNLIFGYEEVNGEIQAKEITVNLMIFNSLGSTIIMFLILKGYNFSRLNKVINRIIKQTYQRKPKETSKVELNKELDHEPNEEQKEISPQISNYNYFKKSEDISDRIEDKLEMQLDSLLPEIREKINISDTNNNFYNKLQELNISEKTFDKAMHYYDRTIFKPDLNPCSKDDLEVLKNEEVQFLNDLGLVRQEKEFPYMIRIVTDEMLIREARTFQNYVKDRGLIIPDLKNIDQLNNGFEFEKYVANLLAEIEFIDIIRLNNFDKNGADILASKNNIRYAFKCKYYSKQVGVSALKEVLKGTVYHYARVPVVVTNYEFNKNAKEYAEKYNIQLWDRYKIIKLLESVSG